MKSLVTALALLLSGASFTPASAQSASAQMNAKLQRIFQRDLSGSDHDAIVHHDDGQRGASCRCWRQARSRLSCLRGCTTRFAGGGWRKG